MNPIIGHHYRLNQNPYPGRVYRCVSVDGDQVNLRIVKRDESETEADISIVCYRFCAMAEETGKP